MSLNEKQFAFALCSAKLITHIFESGYQCSLGEAFRTKEQAAIYAAKGIGIIDSQHCKRLAIDLNLFKNGVYLTDTESYRPIGIFWKGLDPRNHWGGDFPKPDGNHFEMKED